MDGCKLEVNGVEGLMAELRALPDAMQVRIMKGAVATGASVIRKAVILEAPESTGPVSEGHPPPGTLKKAIYQARLVDKCSPTLETWLVSVRTGKRAQTTNRGKGNVNLDAYYASWVEYGHYTRVSNGPGPKAARKKIAIAIGAVRWIAPNPFMRRGFDSSRDAAVQAMQRYVTDNLPLATAAANYLKAA